MKKRGRASMKKLYKRSFPILISAIGLSVLYTSASLAGTNNITSDQIRLGDTLSLGAGYYESDTTITIPTVEEVVERGEVNLEDLLGGGVVNGIKNIFANTYAGANNEKIDIAGQDQILNLSDTEDTVIDIGQGEAVTLPFGYYFHNVVLRNSDKNMGTYSPSEVYLGDTLTGDKGYYEGISVQVPTKETVIQRGEVTIDDLVQNDAVEGIAETEASFYGNGNNENNGITAGESKALALDADNVSYLDLGVEEQITLPCGYYAHDVVIKNGVANRGSNSVVLTSTNNTATFEPGYYSGFTVTTNISNAGGTISYKHHVHSTDSTDEFVSTATPSITSDGVADNYRSSVKGGCFTTPVYGTKTVVCGHYEMQSGDASGNYHYNCDNCGKYKYDDHGGYHYITAVDYNNIIGYTCSCGRTRGQVIEAVIAY